MLAMETILCQKFMSCPADVECCCVSLKNIKYPTASLFNSLGKMPESKSKAEYIQDKRQTFFHTHRGREKTS